MPELALSGRRVLVTRPAGQAGELVAELEAKGAEAIAFPVIRIEPRHPDDVAADAHALGEPDIAVFVSRNAVDFGLAWAGSAAICAIGPATAEAITAAGAEVAVRPADGYDSEHLLRETVLQTVQGQNVRIIRGNRGRELLATMLRERGAEVEYLSVYERRLPDYDETTLQALADRLDNGDVDAIIVMSVESLTNLLRLLPDSGTETLVQVPLVTPSKRVLKEAHDRIPGLRAVLAEGPRASDMVRAIVTLAASG
jgi:uroporphyrinogen-III synthase